MLTTNEALTKCCIGQSVRTRRRFWEFKHKTAHWAFGVMVESFKSATAVNRSKCYNYNIIVYSHFTGWVSKSHHVKKTKNSLLTDAYFVVLNNIFRPLEGSRELYHVKDTDPSCSLECKQAFFSFIWSSLCFCQLGCLSYLTSLFWFLKRLSLKTAACWG